MSVGNEFLEAVEDIEHVTFTVVQALHTESSNRLAICGDVGVLLCVSVLLAIGNAVQCAGIYFLFGTPWSPLTP
jgi:hypothetical protein